MFFFILHSILFIYLKNKKKGVGKTVEMLALIMHTLREQNERKEHQRSKGKSNQGGTLVLCPLSTLDQWEAEIEKKIDESKVNCFIYYGSSKCKSVKKLCEYDIGNALALLC